MMWRMFCIGLCLLLLGYACKDRHADSRAVREQLIADGLKIKLEEFEQKEWNKCLERARLLAIVEADSVMRARARAEAVEPVSKPPKPERPLKPETRVLPDSVREKTKRDDQ